MRFTHIPTPPLTLPRDCWGGQRGGMEIWKTASPGYRWHCGFEVLLQADRRQSRYKLGEGCGRGLAWEREIGLVRLAKGRLRILGLLRLRQLRAVPKLAVLVEQAVRVQQPWRFGQFQNGNDVGCPWITVQQPWQDGTLYIKEPSETPGLPASGSGWRAISAARSPQA